MCDTFWKMRWDLSCYFRVRRFELAFLQKYFTRSLILGVDRSIDRISHNSEFPTKLTRSQSVRVWMAVYTAHRADNLIIKHVRNSVKLSTKYSSFIILLSQYYLLFRSYLVRIVWNENSYFFFSRFQSYNLIKTFKIRTLENNLQLRKKREKKKITK